MVLLGKAKGQTDEQIFIHDRFSEIGKSVLVMLLDFSEAVYF